MIGRWRWAGALLLALLAACGGGGSAPEAVVDEDPPLLPTLAEDSTAPANLVDLRQQGLLPMAADDVWTYDRSVGGVVSGTVTRTVLSGPDADGALSLREDDSTDPSAAVTLQYRRADDGWLTLNPFGVRGQYPGLDQALPSVNEAPLLAYPVGTPRRVMRQGSLGADIDGDGKVDYYRAEFTQDYLGRAFITVMGLGYQADRFRNTLVLTLRTTRGDQSTTVTASETASYVPGLGLVRAERWAQDDKGVFLVPAYAIQLRGARLGGQSLPAHLVWQARTSGTANSLFGIASSSSQAVAVGALGTVVSSTDGRTWTARAAGPTAHLLGVATDGTRFVAVGEQGTIVTTDDTVNWTPRSSGTALTLRGITWAGTQFVAVGDAGTVLTSADGTQWTAQASGTGNDLHAVAAGGGRIVAVGASRTILTSTTAQAWTPRTADAQTGDLHGVVWTGVQFLAVGGGTWNTRQTSFDGITWTARDWPGGNDLYGAAWSGTQFAVVGDFGTYNSSPDGLGWVGADWLDGVRKLHGVAWFNGAFIAVGNDGRIVAAAPHGGVNNSLLGITSFGRTAVAVGALGTVRTSDNGTDWTPRVSGVSVHLQAVATSGARLVAVGDLGTVLSSDDGIQWTLRTSGTDRRLRSVAWTGTQFIAAGDAGVLLTSPDGIDWTAQASGTLADLHGVAGHAGMRIAVGADGTLLASADGVLWTQQASQGGTVLNAVVWTGQQFLVVGNAGGAGMSRTLQTSADGLHWTGCDAAIGNAMVAAAWSGQGFVAVGDFGQNQASPDGISWTGLRSTRRNLLAVAWFGGRFVAVGELGVVEVLP